MVPDTVTVPNPGWFYVPKLDPKTGDGYSNSINPGSWIFVRDVNNNPGHHQKCLQWEQNLSGKVLLTRLGKMI
jgi:hypothetical protein